jgi:heme-degrading monooxygenase HmoA
VLPKMTGWTYIWEFEVEPRSVPDFEQHYGPNGTWASLFRRSPGYIETLLLRDSRRPLRYLTIDRWRSAEDYEAFRAQFEREYEQLDAQCAALTTAETHLGDVVEVA